MIDTVVFLFIRLYFVGVPHCRRHIAFYTLTKTKKTWVNAGYSYLLPNSHKSERQTQEIKVRSSQILREQSGPEVAQMVRITVKITK